MIAHAHAQVYRQVSILVMTARFCPLPPRPIALTLQALQDLSLISHIVPPLHLRRDPEKKKKEKKEKKKSHGCSLVYPMGRDISRLKLTLPCPTIPRLPVLDLSGYLER